MLGINVIRHTLAASVELNAVDNLVTVWHNLGVHMNKFKRWGYRIGSRFSTKTYATKDEAKLALFDDFWAATQDDDRLWASD